MDLPESLKPLFIDFLEDDFNKLTNHQYKKGRIYCKALDSLKEYQGPLRKPGDLHDVKFIGTKLVADMKKKLENYCREYGYKYPEATPAKATLSKKRVASQLDTDDGLDDAPALPIRKRTKKQYVPVQNSGAYAILLALLEFDAYDRGMMKNDITRNATAYCSKSFERNPGAQQDYSAWSSIKTLIKKELVQQQGRPVKFFLTEEGRTLAESLKEANSIVFRHEMSTPDRLRQTGANERAVRAPHDREEFHYDGDAYHFWEEGTYEVVFIIDNREVRAQNQRDYFQVKLQQAGVDTESRALSVGDGLWIARNKQTNEEVVLDYIIERKRLDDLASSIKDGRYMEQKVRLGRTGVNNVFYLIEEVTGTELTHMADAIQTSISLSMTNNNFHCIRTKDADGTVDFIKKITNELSKFYERKKLLVINSNRLEYQQDYATILNKFRAKFADDMDIHCTHNYNTFDTMLSKSDLMTAREMFVRMLMTIRGISLEKAILIQKQFKTPRYLIENFDKCDPDTITKYGKKNCESIADVFQNK